MLFVLIINSTLIESSDDVTVSINAIVWLIFSSACERVISSPNLVSQLLFHFSNTIRVVCLFLGWWLIPIVVCIHLLLILLTDTKLLHARRNRKTILERGLHLLPTKHGWVSHPIDRVLQHLELIYHLLRPTWKRAQRRLLLPFPHSHRLVRNVSLF